MNGLVALGTVFARDAMGFAGRARGRLHGLSASWGPGVHAVLGTPEDGTLALFQIVTGELRPRSGSVRVAGRDPARSPGLRRRIGSLQPTAELPDGPSVAAVVELAQRARGARGGGVLEPYGLGALARRRPPSLSLGETRAVELVLALATPDPLLLALHEPLGEMEIADRDMVRRRLRDLARGGTVVLVTTSASADAASLCDRVHLLRAGRLVDGGAGTEPSDLAVWLEPSAGGGGRALASALLARAELGAVGWQGAPAAGGLECVAVRAPDVDAAALATAEECARLGVRVGALRAHPPPAEALVRVSEAPALAAAGGEPAAAAPGRVGVLGLVAAARGIGLGLALWRARARLAARSGGLVVAVGWAFAGAVGAIEAGRAPYGAPDRTLGAVLGLAVPLASFALCRLATGRARLRDSVWCAARFGTSRRLLALGLASGAAAAAALAAAAAALLGLLLAYGGNPAAMAADAWTSGWIAALGAAAYAAWFVLAGTFGRRGGWRWAPLVLDFALGAGAGLISSPWPRAHLRNLAGGAPPLGLGQPASTALLGGTVAVLLLVAALRSGE
ncbi:MAG: hypothetical protein HY744_33720 [Deltaproteobacteria bacterium]|nr:hypothetical protein [Deltaproteobacteria bacterium]